MFSLAIVRTGCLIKFTDAKIWEYFGRYGIYFQSRSSYVSNKDSYSVLVKRIKSGLLEPVFMEHNVDI